MACLPLLLLLAGCSAGFYERSADREVEKILAEKKPVVEQTALPEFKTPREQVETDTIILSLRDCLTQAASRNREYQSRKEDLYLGILDLTYQRYLYRLRYGASGDVVWNRDGRENFTSSLNLNLVKWLATGAELTLNLGQSFLKYLTGDRTKDFQTFASLNILQPLLRGAGRTAALENLTQAERNAVYDIRDFLTYQRDFSVDVAERFFNLLLWKNNLENYQTNYRNLSNILARIEMLSEAGRIDPFQVDQARQNEYSAYQRWLSAYNDYQSSLDSFRIFLGYAPGTRVVLAETELERLLEKGIPRESRGAEIFLDSALEGRLDLMTTFDKVADSGRQLKIARNNLRGKLDLSLEAGQSTETESNPTVDFRNPSYQAGLAFELPLNRISERNAYRRAQINLARSNRSLQAKVDAIRLEVLDSYRNQEEAYQSYLIQKRSLELAEKRIESTDLLLQAGRATTRDLLDAQESYLSSRNALAETVVRNLISQLQLLKNAEQIELDDNGVWQGELYEKITLESNP
ncbi:MAG TPA: TolC family protein [bacterium]|nr:TolC family protein [bacterium]